MLEPCLFCLPPSLLPVALSRDSILNALQDMIGRQSALGFLKSWGADRVRATPEGYEDWAVAEAQDWPFVYWQVMQSGLVYQRALMPEDLHPINKLGQYVSARTTTVYVASAVSTLVDYYDRLGFAEEERITLQVSQSSKGRTLRVGPNSPLLEPSGVPFVSNALTRTLGEWREHSLDLAVELARGILQLFNLHDPPADLMRSAIERNVPPIGYEHMERLW